MYNLSLSRGVIPSDWKKANIVPVYKKGDKNMVENYRPISLLSTVGKVLERCVHQLVYTVISNDIVQVQHGFMSKKSTSTQLVEFYDIIYKNVDNHIQTDVVYLDLAKAFDSVPHNLLLLKLKSYGIGGRLLLWFKVYLSNRRQRVVVEGNCSEYKRVLSGVPQGSILGPLLFVMYINDIVKEINNDSFLYLYADDSKLGRTIMTINDCTELQAELNKLVFWSHKWGLKFNARKCCVMSFLKDKNKIVYNYTMMEQTLDRVSNTADLGLIICDNLRWDDNIMKIVNNANKRLGMLKRSLGYGCNMQVKLLGYKALIRPLLEVNSIIWHCDTRKLLNQVESVQRRATKYILCDYSSSYEERLNRCNLLPLSLRRDYLDIVFLYNYFHDLHYASLNIHFINNRLTRTRAATDALMLPVRPCKHEYHRKWYCNRVVPYWNKLPFECRNLELCTNGTNFEFKINLKLWIQNFFQNNFISDNCCTWKIHCGCSNCNYL
jgi:hypothetical protein